MAWAEAKGALKIDALLMFIASLLWIVAYDTQYAMVDRDDDLKIGVKSSVSLGNGTEPLSHCCRPAPSDPRVGTRLVFQNFIGYLSPQPSDSFFQANLIRSRERSVC